MKKKSSENDQLTGHFQGFILFLRAFIIFLRAFFNNSRTKVKLVIEVNQQSTVLNL